MSILLPVLESPVYKNSLALTMIIYFLIFATFQDSKFIQQITPRVTAVCDALNTWLDDTCLEAIRDTQSGHVSNQLSRCLRIYATIDRIANIEKLVREEIVKVTAYIFEIEVCILNEFSISASS